MKVNIYCKNIPHRIKFNLTKEKSKMDKLEYARTKLGSMKNRWAEVCFRSGVSSKTLYNIVNKEHSPNTATVDAIYIAIKSMKPLKVKK